MIVFLLFLFSLTFTLVLSPYSLGMNFPLILHLLSSQVIYLSHFMKNQLCKENLAQRTKIISARFRAGFPDLDKVMYTAHAAAPAAMTESNSANTLRGTGSIV